MKRIGLATAALMTTLSFNAYAEIDWSGFATVAGGIATGDDAINPDGYTDSLDFKPGTFFALQASSDLGEGLSATVQMMSRGSDDWDPKFTWAYLSYDVNDNFRVLAGRQRLPLYFYSDYLDVSYAYHWIAPPTEVYYAPFDSIDGISGIYTHDMSNSSLTFQMSFGQDTGENNIFEFENIIGGTVTFNYDWLTVRLAHFELEETNFLMGDIDTQNVSIAIDYHDWIAVTEYTPADLTKTIAGDKIEPWMFSVGKRINDFTPHITVGRYLRGDSIYLLPEQDLPFYTVGLRWDFHDSAALKFEYSGEENATGNTAESFQVALVTVF